MVHSGGSGAGSKIVINSVYGLTAANFENPFRRPRNKDNIVAKRGALFMTLLKSEVEKRGFCVAHIKTDSIKNSGRHARDYGLCYSLLAKNTDICLRLKRTLKSSVS